jgi:aminopeptidase
VSDPRHTTLASNLINYSCDLQPGEKVLIEAIDIPHAFTRELVRASRDAGAQPFVSLKSQEVWRSLLLDGSAEQMQLLGDFEASRMAEMDAYIGVRGSNNVSEWSDIPTDKIELYESTVWQKAHLEIRVPKTKWVVLRWPNPGMAQLAQMSTEGFEEFYFSVCNIDYAKMSAAMQPLQELMQATDRVRLVAPGTDLTMSIKEIPAICCDGHRNVPDGEVFTAPIRESVNGVIQYNTPTIYQGVTHENVWLEFSDGRIVAASSSQPDHLETVLDSDEGARFIGEFAIGFHPRITKPMKDILFDEKIAGSIHLTPGQAYKEAWNGNTSQIHWDLILRMDPEAGGGEVWFDDVLIRKDGVFILPELEGLNPGRLTT